LVGEGRIDLYQSENWRETDHIHPQKAKKIIWPPEPSGDFTRGSSTNQLSKRGIFKIIRLQEATKIYRKDESLPVLAL